jgi:hypothetical protein
MLLAYHPMRRVQKNHSWERPSGTLPGGSLVFWTCGHLERVIKEIETLSICIQINFTIKIID